MHTKTNRIMATFRYHLRPSKVKGSDEGRLFIRVIHQRKMKDISTSYPIRSDEWDERSGRIVYGRSDHSRNRYLTKIEEKMSNDLACLRSIESDLASAGDYTAADLAEGFKALFEDKGSLIAFCERVSAGLIDNGQIRTARAYRSAVRSLRRFRQDSNLKLEEIDAALMRNFESYLKGQGLGKNTISFYMRNLRALYYRAVEEKLIPIRPENPFAHVYTGVSVSKKKALDLKDIRSLRKLEEKLSGKIQREENGRRRRTMEKIRESLMYFDFCLEARGMSWVDMVFLKKSDLKGDSFTYRRRKTKGELDIIITPTMKKIMLYFTERTKRSAYVFPIIDPARGSELGQYASGLRVQNGRLATAARMAGLDKKVTTHVSRHSWATIAKREKIDISLISELLGHSNIKTTYRYLASFDQNEVARVTAQVSRVLQRAS